MIIRITAGDKGAGRYLEVGYKKNRKDKNGNVYKRIDLDRREMIDGNLELFEKANQESLKSRDWNDHFHHITFSFEPDEWVKLSDEDKRAIVRDKLEFMYGVENYDHDILEDIAYHAEAHVPKLAKLELPEGIEDDRPEEERKPHIHLLVSLYSLKTGNKIIQRKFHEATFEDYQSYQNKLYGLRDPRDVRFQKHLNFINEIKTTKPTKDKVLKKWNDLKKGNFPKDVSNKQGYVDDLIVETSLVFKDELKTPKQFKAFFEKLPLVKDVNFSNLRNKDKLTYPRVTLDAKALKLPRKNVLTTKRFVDNPKFTGLLRNFNNETVINRHIERLREKFEFKYKTPEELEKLKKAGKDISKYKTLADYEKHLEKINQKRREAVDDIYKDREHRRRSIRDELTRKELYRAWMESRTREERMFFAIFKKNMKISHKQLEDWKFFRRGNDSNLVHMYGGKGLYVFDDGDRLSVVCSNTPEALESSARAAITCALGKGWDLSTISAEGSAAFKEAVERVLYEMIEAERIGALDNSFDPNDEKLIERATELKITKEEQEIYKKGQKSKEANPNDETRYVGSKAAKTPYTSIIKQQHEQFADKLNAQKHTRKEKQKLIETIPTDVVLEYAIKHHNVDPNWFTYNKDGHFIRDNGKRKGDPLDNLMFLKAYCGLMDDQAYKKLKELRLQHLELERKRKAEEKMLAYRRKEIAELKRYEQEDCVKFIDGQYNNVVRYLDPKKYKNMALKKGENWTPLHSTILQSDGQNFIVHLEDVATMEPAISIEQFMGIINSCEKVIVFQNAQDKELDYLEALVEQATLLTNSTEIRFNKHFSNGKEFGNIVGKYIGKPADIGGEPSETVRGSDLFYSFTIKNWVETIDEQKNKKKKTEKEKLEDEVKMRTYVAQLKYTTKYGRRYYELDRNVLSYATPEAIALGLEKHIDFGKENHDALVDFYKDEQLDMNDPDYKGLQTTELEKAGEVIAAYAILRKDMDSMRDVLWRGDFPCAFYIERGLNKYMGDKDEARELAEAIHSIATKRTRDTRYLNQITKIAIEKERSVKKTLGLTPWGDIYQSLTLKPSGYK